MWLFEPPVASRWKNFIRPQWRRVVRTTADPAIGTTRPVTMPLSYWTRTAIISRPSGTIPMEGSDPSADSKPLSQAAEHEPSDIDRELSLRIVLHSRTERFVASWAAAPP